MNTNFSLVGLMALVIDPTAGAQTYTQFGNSPIPDFSQNFIWDMVVNDNVVIGDLNAGLLIEYTWQGDLIVRLIHLNTGTTMTLVNRPGGTGQAVGFSADNYGNPSTNAFFVLDDEAANIYDTPFVPSPGITNVTGHWKPDAQPTDGVGNMGVFDGENIQGTWRIFITDHAISDIGSFRGLQLQVTPIPVPAVVATLGLAGLVKRRRRRA